MGVALTHPHPHTQMLLGVDIGGTFTDFVLVDEAGRVRLHKRLASPEDPARSVAEGVREMALPAGPSVQVVHGSTIATNALLERRGARTALITTAGFADVLEIGRQNRPELYVLVPHKPPPLVPRAWRFEVRERVTSEGDILMPLDPREIVELAPRLQAEGIESVAVCFLFSFLRPEHERMVEKELKALMGTEGTASSPSSCASFISLHFSLSSEILPEYREYERTSTTVVNAYVAPLMDRYLCRLEAALSPRPLRVMQSNGGCLTAAAARRLAARTALSGPAGGVVGAFEAARQALTPHPGSFGAGGRGVRVITFDMGGTSTDVCLCPGHLPFTSEGEIGGLPLRLPIIDIHTVGAGGGSIARLDDGGALTVGPESAGADPGPACYGRGGRRVTVTDANLMLNRLDPAHFLGGKMRLKVEAGRAAVAELAAQLSFTSLAEAAWGVIQVANAAMERAIRKISVERGFDPRDFTLVAFGGAGPLHACELVERLGIPRVLVPRAPGVLSALGMLLADLVKDYSLTIMRRADALAEPELWASFAPLETRASREMAQEGLTLARLERSVDARYVGQSFEINVPLKDDPLARPQPAQRASQQGNGEYDSSPRFGRSPTGLGEGFRLADLLRDFHARHAQRYGHAHPGEPVEWVTLRVRAVGLTPKPVFEELPPGGADASAACLDERPAWFEGETGLAPLPTRLFDRAKLLAGNRLEGPAIIVQLDATTVVPPGWAGQVDRWGHLLLEKL